MKKRFALSGVLVLGLGILLTDCSSPSQSAAKPPQSVAAVHRTTSPGSHKQTTHKTLSASSVTFNPVIKRAMNILSVSPLPKTPLYAPTVTPIPYSPDRRNISAFVNKSKMGKDAVGYTVNLYWLANNVPVNSPELLNRYPTSVYAGFSGMTYASSVMATDRVFLSTGKRNMPVQGNTINLGNGIMGIVFHIPAKNGSLEDAVIEWQEGRWNMQVHHYNSQVPLVSLAREMVAYLHTAFLPAPDSRGAINVASEGPAYTYTKVAWTKSNNLYQVFNNVNAIDALKMAVSMRLFTK